MSSQIIMLEGCSQLMDKGKFDSPTQVKQTYSCNQNDIILFYSIKQFSVALR